MGQSARPQRSSPIHGPAGLTLVLVLAACSGATDPPTPPDTEAPLTELVLSLPDTLLVHGSALLTVTGRSADGAVVQPPSPVLFTTSDHTIATVSAMGVVFGANRGTVTITASSGSVHGSLTITVRARVAVTLIQGLASPDYLVAVGDTLALAASFIDIDGIPIHGEGPVAVTWSSSNPAAVSVGEDGRAIAVRPRQSALVTASTANEGSGSTSVFVDSVAAGLPATVRFAHAAPELGPLTFRPSRGRPVTVSLGRSVEVPVGSGFFYVTLDGVTIGQQDGPLAWTTLIRPGAHLSLFGVGRVRLVPVWAPGAAASDSGMVRLIQGSAYLVVDLLPTGAPAEGTPELCYFDPGAHSEYFIRPPGPFDILLEKKYQSGEVVRLPANAPAGRPVTLVLTGGSAETAGYLSFADP